MMLCLELGCLGSFLSSSFWFGCCDVFELLVLLCLDAGLELSTIVDRKQRNTGSASVACVDYVLGIFLRMKREMKG